jgi:PTS system mannose-specific IIA component
MQQRRNDILAAVDAADDGDGVIILTDMFGGTPSNLAISVMQNREVEVIAGVNLPMLVKLARVRADQPIKEAVRIAAEAGRKYINVANDVLDS